MIQLVRQVPLQQSMLDATFWIAVGAIRADKCPQWMSCTGLLIKWVQKGVKAVCHVRCQLSVVCFTIHNKDTHTHSFLL